MRIGIFGAGKAGFTLGKYFSDRGVDVVGYWSRNQSRRKMQLYLQIQRITLVPKS